MIRDGRLIIATRESELALWQANHVAGLLRAAHDGLEVELLPMTTRGDRILDQPLAQIGGKGLFLKELETALLEDRADIAVHSMKDVPAIGPGELPVDTVLERANPFDALLSVQGLGLSDMPYGARVGTSSLRRQCQVRALRPDLEVAELRGNVNTRIRKLEEGQYAAIVLACAGLERLGLESRVTEVLRPPSWLPAGTQGTIGIQRRAEDEDTRALLAPLQHAETALITRVERAIARVLHGSCQVPLAVYARIEAGAEGPDREGDQLAIDALVGEPDGTRLVRSARRGAPETADRLAADVAEHLLAQGAGDIIEALSRTTS